MENKFIRESTNDQLLEYIKHENNTYDKHYERLNYIRALITNNTNNNSKNYYRENKDPEFNNMLFQYIGILCSLDESDIYDVFIKDFITNLNTGTYIKLPYMRFAQLLHIHLYGIEMIAMEEISAFIELYKEMKKDIELLEQIGINIKKELGCGVESDDNSTCFSNDDDDLTLYELAHSVIQIKLSDIKINKEEFIKKISFVDHHKEEELVIVGIIETFDDNKLRYFIRFGTGNILMPKYFTISIDDDAPHINTDVCFNKIIIPSFNSYKKMMKNKNTPITDYHDYIENTLFSDNILQTIAYDKSGGKRKIKNTKKNYSKNKYLFNKSKKILHK